MANIGSMAVNLLAKTFGFDRPVDKSRAKYNRLRRDVRTSKIDFNRAETAVNKLGFSLKGLVAGATLAGISRLGHDTLMMADALGKQAISLGVNVSQLDKYQFAAGRAGIETNKISDAIRSMNQKLGEAKAGMGEARTFFQAVNIDLEQFMKLDPAAQFERLGKVLSALPDQNSKVAAFGKIFGEGAGAELIRFFSGGNLEKASKDLKALGGALTEKEAAAAAAYADAVGDIGRAFNRLKQEIAFFAGPEVTAAMQLFIESAGIIRGLTGGVSTQTRARTLAGGGFLGLARLGASQLTPSNIKTFRDTLPGRFGNRAAPNPLNPRQAAAQQGTVSAPRTDTLLQQQLSIQQRTQQHIQDLVEFAKRENMDPPIILNPAMGLD